MRVLWLPTWLMGLLCLWTPSTAEARPYQLDYAHSAIQFHGEHAGEPFSGQFEDWEAEIVFNPEDLTASHIHAIIRTESATTGNALYDGTLPQADWFAVVDYPQAIFQSETITQSSTGDYEVTGTLTLRGIEQPVAFTFPFLPDAESGTVTTNAKLKLNRLDYAIGQKSDPTADWVSRDIGLTLRIVAQ